MAATQMPTNMGMEKQTLAQICTMEYHSHQKAMMADNVQIRINLRTTRLKETRLKKEHILCESIYKHL